MELKIQNNQKELQEKKENTKLEKYGDKNYNNREKFKETNLERFGVEYPIQNEEILNKQKQTNIELYGVENIGQSKEARDKMKKTCVERYDSECYFQSVEYREKLNQKYFEIYRIYPEERNLQFKYYRNEVNLLTKKNKEKLYKNWDGYDFYDGEYIKENFKLNSNDKKYPTIDHKISIYYGFKNNISPEEISKLKNLCITKRTLNSKKHSNCYEG